MIKEKREKLYKEIVEKHENGLKVVEIAKLYDISRQHVYEILRQQKKSKSQKLDKK